MNVSKCLYSIINYHKKILIVLGTRTEAVEAGTLKLVGTDIKNN